MGYQTIEVRKLSPVIGAEIFGVDLARPLGNQVFQEIHDALMDNLVIFFRDQELTHEQHKTFGRLAVVPEARGQGIARRLIEAVEDEARRRELAGVRLGVRIVLTENQRFFASLGYVEISREAHEGFDHPTSINMRKTL